MTTLTLRAIKAKHGDALLLFAEGATVLIDGGPSGVYSQALRDQLLNLESNNQDPPRIDLLMVSHIDADHIDGVLDLTAELIEAREDEREPLVRIDRAWHNSFSDVVAQSGVATSSKVSASAASVASAFDDLTGMTFDPRDSKLVLASVAQGRRLRLDLKALNTDLNARFKDRVVLQGGARMPWHKGSLNISVVGPTRHELDRLKDEWAEQVKAILSKDASATAAAAKKLDKSVTNLASIVAIATVGEKSVLLTGDARGDMIIDWLEQSGELRKDGVIHFDILKLPHHGSDRNVSPEFFKRVTADNYVVCGNGAHGNPEPRMLQMLFDARPDLDYYVHMTYGPDELKSNKSFKKAGNVSKLDAVLDQAERRAILKYPKFGEMHIDIQV